MATFTYLRNKTRKQLTIKAFNGLKVAPLEVFKIKTEFYLKSRPKLSLENMNAKLAFATQKEYYDYIKANEKDNKKTEQKQKKPDNDAVSTKEEITEKDAENTTDATENKESTAEETAVEPVEEKKIEDEGTENAEGDAQKNVTKKRTSTRGRGNKKNTKQDK